MTTPTFVNVGQTSGSFATSKTAVMPASIVAGNLLIGFLSLNLTSGATPSWPAGWTVAYLYNTSGFTISIAWKIAVGGDAAPTVSWTGNTDVQLSVAQYTGNHATSPIGNIAANPHPSGGTTAVSGTAVTTANNNSTVATWCMLNNTGSVTVEPSGSWTKEINSTALHLVMYDTPMVSAGAAPTFALTFSASILYDVIEVELKAPTTSFNLTASIADDTGLSAALTVWSDIPVVIKDDGGLSATLALPPTELLATITDDLGLTATEGSGGRDLSAAFADDLGVDATLDVINAGNLHLTLTDDHGLSGTLSVTTASVPVQQVVICI